MAPVGWEPSQGPRGGVRYGLLLAGMLSVPLGKMQQPGGTQTAPQVVQPDVTSRLSVRFLVLPLSYAAYKNTVAALTRRCGLGRRHKYGPPRAAASAASPGQAEDQGRADSPTQASPRRPSQ